MLKAGYYSSSWYGEAASLLVYFMVRKHALLIPACVSSFSLRPKHALLLRKHGLIIARASSCSL